MHVRKPNSKETVSVSMPNKPSNRFYRWRNLSFFSIEEGVTIDDMAFTVASEPAIDECRVASNFPLELLDHPFFAGVKHPGSVRSRLFDHHYSTDAGCDVTFDLQGADTTTESALSEIIFAALHDRKPPIIINLDTVEPGTTLIGYLGERVGDIADGGSQLIVMRSGLPVYVGYAHLGTSAHKSAVTRTNTPVYRHDRLDDCDIGTAIVGIGVRDFVTTGIAVNDAVYIASNGGNPLRVYGSNVSSQCAVLHELDFTAMTSLVKPALCGSDSMYSVICEIRKTGRAGEILRSLTERGKRSWGNSSNLFSAMVIEAVEARARNQITNIVKQHAQSINMDFDAAMAVCVNRINISSGNLLPALSALVTDDAIKYLLTVPDDVLLKNYIAGMVTGCGLHSVTRDADGRIGYTQLTSQVDGSDDSLFQRRTYGFNALTMGVTYPEFITDTVKQLETTKLAVLVPGYDVDEE